MEFFSQITYVKIILVCALQSLQFSKFEVCNIEVPSCCNHRYKELASRQGTTYMPGGKV